MTISFVQELAFGRQVIGIETDSVSGQKRRVIRLGGLINNGLVNKLTNPQAFDQWTLSVLTPTVDAAVAPDGTTTADLLVPTAVNSNHSALQQYTKSLATEVHTFSLFAKPAGFNFVNLRVDDGGANFAQVSFNVSTGVSSNSTSGGTAVLQSSFITPASNGWYFIGLTLLTGAVNTAVRDILYVSNTASITATGDAVSGAYLWQGQSVFGPISGPLNFVL